MGFQWDDARYFLALARTGQLARAAELLGVSTITLSRRLKQIQAMSEAPLWLRNRYGLTLTDEGRQLLSHFERVEADMEAARDVLEGSASGAIHGTVRLAAPDGFVSQILSPRLDGFVSAHPRLRLEVVPQPRGFSMSRREADLAVMVGQPTETDLMCEHLADYTLGVYASRKYLKTHGVPHCVEDLTTHRLIGYVDDLLFSPRLNLQKTIWHRWQSNVAIYSPVAQVEAVNAGAGIGVLHTFLIQDRDLVQVLPHLQLKRAFYLVSHPHTDQLPRIQACREFLHQLIQAVRM